ncbi:MAG: transglutaminase-like domain-containing protein [Defluviitaleaceae bacterium]|nr:transglutaminase-like domain-containing protein [Defluviitaleaceae bacterium]
MKRFDWRNDLFFIAIGTLFVWALFMAIIAMTELNFDPQTALFRAFFVVVLLRLIVFNKYTLLAAGGILLVAAAIVAIDVAVVANIEYYEHMRASIFDNISDGLLGTMRYIMGFEGYIPLYDTIISWSITIMLGVLVLTFGYLWFNFYSLLVLSFATFAISLTSSFFEYYLAFYVFIFCLVAYLVKHLNLRSLGGSKSSPFVLYAMPLTALCLIVALAIPAPAAGSAEAFRQGFTRPFVAINHGLQSMLHPRFFSLSQTGFGGGGTRQLGGDVSVDNGLAMRINPSVRGDTHYLAGAFFDVYSENTWDNSFREDVRGLDFMDISQTLDQFERATSALTMWSTKGFFEEIERLSDIIYEQTAQERQDFEEHMRINIEGLLQNNASEMVLSGAYSQLQQYHAQMDIFHHNQLMGALSLQFRDLWWYETPFNFDRFDDLDILIGRLPFFIGLDRTLAETVIVPLDHENIIIEHDFRSQSVFSKSGATIGIVPNDRRVEMLIDGGGTITATELMRRGEGYTVHFTQVGENVDTHRILEASYRGVLRDAYNALQYAVDGGFDERQLDFWIETEPMEFLLMDFGALLYDQLIPRADWIFDNYTQLPDDLPIRIAALAHYVTQDAENDFERAVMITEFLRSFDYTLTPGNTPVDRDFVDWFLFDAQTGYCVHFATAFVVMMRSLGIPARYVEGFAANGNVGIDGFMDVINRQGHAWAEVYFEGFGWYIFEPTPSGAIFSWDEYVVTNIVETAPTWGGTRDWSDFEFSSPFVEGGEEDWDSDFVPPQINNAPTDGGGTQAQAGQNFQETEQNVSPQPMDMATLLMISVYIVGLGLLGYLILRIIGGILRHKRLRKRDNNAVVVAYYTEMIKYLSFFHYEAEENDTPLEFAQKIGNRILLENETISIEDIALIYYRSLYSDRLITAEERNTIELAFTALEYRLKNYVGAGRFYFYKYIKAAFS